MSTMINLIDRLVYAAATAMAVSTDWTMMEIWLPPIDPRHSRMPRVLQSVSVSDISVMSLCVIFCVGMHSHISYCSQSFPSQKLSVPSLFFSTSCPWRKLRVQVEYSTSSAAHILQIGLAGRVPEEIPIISSIPACAPQSILRPCPQEARWPPS